MGVVGNKTTMNERSRLAPRRFRGETLSLALGQARRELGGDAQVLRARKRWVRHEPFEVVAAPPAHFPLRASRAIDVAPPIAAISGTARVVAAVGPPASGKTTVLAQLAARATLGGGFRVGLIVLEPRGVGEPEPLRAFAELLGLPMAMAAGPHSLPAALATLPGRDLFLVDTPGISARDDRWISALTARLDETPPDETWLVLPATIAAGAASAVARRLGPLRPDRLAIAHLDQGRPEGWSDWLGKESLPVRAISRGPGLTDGDEARDVADLADWLGLSARPVIGLEAGFGRSSGNGRISRISDSSPSPPPADN